MKLSASKTDTFHELSNQNEALFRLQQSLFIYLRKKLKSALFQITILLVHTKQNSQAQFAEFALCKIEYSFADMISRNSNH